jgi:hypothetical protein
LEKSSVKSPKLVAVAALAIFALAACSAASTAPTDAGTASSAPTDAGTASSAPGGETAAPASAAGAVDLCALLSPADLKTVTGDDYGAGVLNSLRLCVWRVGGAAVNNGDGQVVADDQGGALAAVKSAFAGGVDVTVSGHDGYWDPAEGLQSIWVDLGGGRTLVLSFDPVAPDGQAIAQALAEIAIGNI